MFSSPYLDWAIERVALNAKVVGGPHGDKDKMVAASSENRIILWSIQDGGNGSEIGGWTAMFSILEFLTLIRYLKNIHTFQNYREILPKHSSKLQYICMP